MEQQETRDTGSLSGQLAVVLVAATSGLVLVLEILAGRLMAPFIGVSLDTFTGIIGTILAGIAAGAAVGGNLADKHDPVQLIARSLLLGGALTWLSIPIVAILGPSVGAGPPAIVVLTAAAFFLPAAVLSGIGPMVAKLQLGSIAETGAVVGRLSAASTFGALVGTFGSGFVLIAFLPVRTIIIGVGAVLLVAGLGLAFKTGRGKPSAVEVAAVLFVALVASTTGSGCGITTTYYCVNIIADAPDDPEGRDHGRSLIIDGLRHAHVDLDDAEFLDIRYMRIFAAAAETLPAGPLRVLHVGGGGFSLPRYISSVRPGSTNTVLELDADLVDIARTELGLTDADALDIRTGDARLHLDDLETDGFDLIVGDAFGGSSVPWHLTTVEVMREIDRLLAPGGTYVMNVIDGGDSRFARAELATLGEVFGNLSMIEPQDGIPNRPVNQVLIASHTSIPLVPIVEEDGRQLSASEVSLYVGEDAIVLTDDFAPADQLLP